MGNAEDPLVSILVITYNSSRHVLETLESARAQTYRNIELIVSDDCSTDDTVNVCQQWMNANRARFLRAEMVTVAKNTGIAANCNRGWHAARGTWIKLIAGDDILAENCITANVEFVSENENVEILASRFTSFAVADGERKTWRHTYPEERRLKFFNLPAEKQYQWFLTDSFNIAPTAFIKAATLAKLGGFDEGFPFIEDRPFFLKATRAGIKISLLDQVTCYYRMHPGSIRVGDDKALFSTKFMESQIDFKKKMVYPNVPLYRVVFWQDEWLRRSCYWLVARVFANKRTVLTSFIFRAFNCLDINNMKKKYLRLRNQS